VGTRQREATTRMNENERIDRLMSQLSPTC
jgi:hypothetical protein